MKFLQDVKDSIYNPQFYEHVASQEMSVAVKYFAKIVFVVACALSAVPLTGGIGLLTWNHSQVDDIRTDIIEAFPSDLELSIRNGEISTNATEPYEVALPKNTEQWAVEADAPYEITNLVVIDTTKSIETADFKKHQTLFVIGKNEIGMFNPDKNKVEIQSLSHADLTYTLNRENFESLVFSAWKILTVAAIVFLTLLPFFIFFGLFIGYGIYLVFGALVVWLAGSILNHTLSYGQAYKVSLYAITLPLIGNFAVPFVFHVPFVFTLVLFAVAYANFKQRPASQSSDITSEENMETPDNGTIL